MVGHAAGKELRTFFFSVGKSERQRLPGIPRCGWEDNFKIDPTEIGWESMDWNDLAHDSNEHHIL